jgi:hypothetical protein
MNKFFPLFNTDGAAGSAATGNESAKATPPAGPSAEEIARLRAEAQEAARLKAELEKERERAKVVFSRDADPAKRQEAIREQLRSAGWSQQDIDAWAARQQQGSDEEEEIEEEERPAPKGKGGRKSEEDEEIKTLKQRLAELEQAHAAGDRKQTESELNQEVERVYEADTTFKKAMSRLEKDAPEEDRKFLSEMRPQILSEIRKATLEEIRAKQSRTGLRPSSSWIPEAAAAAGPKVLKKYSQLVMSASRIGRDSTMDDLESILKQPEVKMPKPSDRRNINEVERDMGEAMADRLIRTAATLEMQSGKF